MTLPKWLKELYIGFLKTLGLWMLMIGLTCLILSYTNAFNRSTEFNSFLNSIGSAILSGGVFAVILKSFQFLGIFKEELAEIIYEAKYLESRKDIEEIWRKVSKTLYKSKFPQISTQIENTILEKYFPKDVSYYYDDLNVTLEISADEGNFIAIEEWLKFTVIALQPTDENPIAYKESIRKVPADKTSYDLVRLAVNGADRTAEIKADSKWRKIEDTLLTVDFSFPLSNANKYDVEMAHKKIQNPAIDNIIEFVASKFINRVKLTIINHCAKDLNLTFFSQGTPEDFAPIQTSASTISKKYEGLIFPNQGYRITLYRR